MICVLSGPNHAFEFVNDAHIKALGFDATGMSVRQARPESTEVYCILDEVYRTGLPAALRELAVTVTDRLRYFNLTYSPRRDVDGTVSGVMILGDEVTEVVEARKILESSEQSLRQFLNAIPTTFWSATSDGTIDFLNQFWAAYSGQDLSDAPRQQRWREISHEGDRSHSLSEWRAAVGEGQSIDQGFRLRRVTDGKYRWHHCRGAPLKNQAGKITRWAGYISDIDDEKVALEGLTAERDIRERFVATLTHDLRTPLTAARMSAQLLFRPAIDPVLFQKVCSRIIDNIDRADQMIRDLLDANRIKAGERLPLEIKPVVLNEIALF